MSATLNVESSIPRRLAGTGLPPYLRLPVVMLGVLSLLTLAGCATLSKPQNTRIDAIDGSKGYRLLQTRSGDYGDHLIFLAFSGGGTRAAALSYGVLQELRHTRLNSPDRQVRLIDEVDSISSVSGGSFTAAYYGLFGDKTFTDYERVFLRQSIQGTLIRKLFDPAYWWRSLFSGFDRTEMAIEYYDRHIFEHATFADLQAAGGPFVEINATDLGGGNRFTFTQSYFDMICSDLAPFPVARAVTASSAVPVAFPTVVLKNFSGDCDLKASPLFRYLSKEGDNNERLRELQQRMRAYTDRRRNPYLHIVDGGISDNLGLRAVTDRIQTFRGGFLFEKGKRIPKDLVIISVNAAVDPERSINQSPSKPSVVNTVNAVTDVQMSLYNKETKLALGNTLKHMDSALEEQGKKLRFYQIEVSFESLPSRTLKSYFNNLPTSLELSDHDIDMLIAAGRNLLRKDPGYQELLKANGGTLEDPGPKLE